MNNLLKLLTRIKAVLKCAFLFKSAPIQLLNIYAVARSCSLATFRLCCACRNAFYFLVLLRVIIFTIVFAILMIGIVVVCCCICYFSSGTNYFMVPTYTSSNYSAELRFNSLQIFMIQCFKNLKHSVP